MLDAIVRRSRGLALALLAVAALPAQARVAEPGDLIVAEVSFPSSVWRLEPSIGRITKLLEIPVWDLAIDRTGNLIIAASRGGARSALRHGRTRGARAARPGLGAPAPAIAALTPRRIEAWPTR